MAKHVDNFLFRVENFFLLDPPHRKWKNKTETCILRVIEFILMEQELFQVERHLRVKR